MLDEHRAEPLDGVGAGLVARLAARPVRRDLSAASARKRTVLALTPHRHALRVEASATAVSTSCVRPDSRPSMCERIRPVARLPEDFAVEHHGGIGAEHRQRLVLLPDRQRLRRAPGAARIRAGASPGAAVSSMSAPVTMCGTPICSSSSRRRGDTEARQQDAVDGRHRAFTPDDTGDSCSTLWARYSCSASTTRTRACGKVSLRQRPFEVGCAASTSGAKPSGPPMRKATSRPSLHVAPPSHVASCAVVISLPRSSSATTYSSLRDALRAAARLRFDRALRVRAGCGCPPRFR